MNTKPLIKTPISYYGGNQAVISHILPLIPEHRIYTESFFGGGTVFWAKKPVDNETINDKLDIVINFYRVLKTKYSQLKKLVDVSLISRTMHTTANKICLNHFPADDVTRAWAFWYASNFSHSCRLNGGIKMSNHSDSSVTKLLANKKQSFTEQLAARIENTQIENTDAFKVLNSRNIPGAFHFLDTPYPGADQGHYKGYTEADLSHLLNWLGHECKGKFLLLNYQSELIDEFSRIHGWHKKNIEHRIAAPRKSGDTKKLVLIWNYDIFTKTDLFNNEYSRQD